MVRGGEKQLICKLRLWAEVCGLQMCCLCGGDWIAKSTRKQTQERSRQ
jgi:hypothetical protein